MKTHLQIGPRESACASGKKKGIEMGPKFDGEHLHNLPSVSPNKQFFPAPIFSFLDALASLAFKLSVTE